MDTENIESPKKEDLIDKPAVLVHRVLLSDEENGNYHAIAKIKFGDNIFYRYRRMANFAEEFKKYMRIKDIDWPIHKFKSMDDFERFVKKRYLNIWK
jgi:hypothetical protein